MANSTPLDRISGPPRLTDDFWESRYNSGQTGWDRGGVSPALEHWIASGALPAPGSTVMIPGCGRGYEVEYLAARGYAVTAVDVASTPLTELAERLLRKQLRATLVRADLLQWSPATPFDWVYEQTCLCALEPNQWAEYVQRLADWVRPGGLLAALFLQTGKPGGPPFHCDPVEMRKLLPPSEWTWADDDSVEIPHPAGFKELGFLLRRRLSASA